jgi:hypothetical protein
LVRKCNNCLSLFQLMRPLKVIRLRALTACKMPRRPKFEALIWTKVISADLVGIFSTKLGLKLGMSFLSKKTHHKLSCLIINFAFIASFVIARRFLLLI